MDESGGKELNATGRWVHIEAGCGVIYESKAKKNYRSVWEMKSVMKMYINLS